MPAQQTLHVSESSLSKLHMSHATFLHKTSWSSVFERWPDIEGPGLIELGSRVRRAPMLLGSIPLQTLGSGPGRSALTFPVLTLVRCKYHTAMILAWRDSWFQGLDVRIARVACLHDADTCCVDDRVLCDLVHDDVGWCGDVLVGRPALHRSCFLQNTQRILLIMLFKINSNSKVII